MSRRPPSEHRARPWIFHDLAPDFTLEDVWRIPAPGSTADDLQTFIARVHEHGARQPALVRLLFAVRWRLGAWLGWDGKSSGLGARVQTLRDRLPEDRRADPDVVDLGFLTPVYVRPMEMAAEVANATVHGALHYGWVPDGDCYALELAVYTSANGRWGRAYMALIRPFRLLIVWPSMLRQWGRAWVTGNAVDHR